MAVERLAQAGAARHASWWQDAYVRTLLLPTVLIGAVAVVVAAMLARGLLTGRPPGQRGLKGTSLENSRGLFLVQMTTLGFLELACLGGLAWLWLRA
jgi:hypothetical protein